MYVTTNGIWLFLDGLCIYALTLLVACVIYLCVTRMANIIMYDILDLYRCYFLSLPVVVDASLLSLCRWFPRPFRWCQKGEDKYDHAL